MAGGKIFGPYLNLFVPVGFGVVFKFKCNSLLEDFFIVGIGHLVTLFLLVLNVFWKGDYILKDKLFIFRRILLKLGIIQDKM